jgi:dynein heavy chain
LVDNAKKQLTIEENLNKIEKMWIEDKKSNLDVEPQTSKADNEKYFFIKSTDVIMEIIEEHGTLLGSMKSSPYYKEFSEKIDYWEGQIATITETLEILLQVQSKWKYLESIFKGQPDISKQLPNEDAIFRRNHIQFKEEMERINKTKNCKNALTEKKNFLQELYELNEQFEKIQKYLKQFLESKRSQFPRFYFLSDEDLLEIIGQSKDPKPILQHIRKMFEGVHTLDINESNSGSRGSKSFDIVKLVNDDEETVDLQK